MLAIPVAERAAQHEALGMAPGIAEAVAAAADEAMDRCILALYRRPRSRRWRASASNWAMPRPGPASSSPTEDGYTGGDRRAR